MEVRKGSQSKESCGGGKQKEAAGSYRRRGPEGVPVERELRKEWRGVVRGGGRGRKKEGVGAEEI